MSLAGRKRVELGAKLDSIELEIDHWLAESAVAAPGRPDTPLAKHHTQVRRVARELLALTGRVRAALDADAKAGRLLDTWLEIEGMAVDAHQVWDFFRGKLALRYVGFLRPYLVAADELAWACYRPAQAAGTGPHHLPAEAVKEPPLTFFSASGSPFALPRGRSYEQQAGGGLLRTAEFRAALKALPVPVIGMPWHLTRHGPDALVLCHEVGHHVEDDLRLTGTMRRRTESALLAEGVPAARRQAWLAWLGEVFADVYGVLAAGPAFVAALGDFLAASPATVAAELIGGPPWGRYPSTCLRALLGFEALDRAGFAEEATSARAAWTGRHPTHAMAAFDPDVGVVVRALLDGPYPELGGVGLTSVVGFQGLHGAAAVDAERLLTKGYEPLSTDPRALFAAGALAFARDPATYAALDVARRVVDRVVECQAAGTRFRGGGDAAPDRAALDARDDAAGAALFELLRRRAAGGR
jgi:hypothetical protein